MVAHTVARRPECGVGGVEHGHLMARMKVIYKITWPNGKIYVGKDRIEADFMRLAATPLPIPAPAPDDAVPTLSTDPSLTGGSRHRFGTSGRMGDGRTAEVTGMIGEPSGTRTRDPLIKSGRPVKIRPSTLLANLPATA